MVKKIFLTKIELFPKFQQKNKLEGEIELLIYFLKLKKKISNSIQKKINRKIRLKKATIKARNWEVLVILAIRFANKR